LVSPYFLYIWPFSRRTTENGEEVSLLDERIYLLAMEYLLFTVSVLAVSKIWLDHYDELGD
jgi:hypothetical protein